MKRKALVVDDVELNRGILRDILEEDFEVVEACNGVEALDLMEKNLNALGVIMLDIIMPELDGYGVLENMKGRGWVEKIPVLVITSETRNEMEFKCLDYGIADFIRKPFNELLVKKRVSNAVQLYSYKNHLEEEVKAQTAEISRKNEILVGMNDNVIQLLGDVVEARNKESGQHVKRVKQFTKILAKDVQERFPEYGLSDTDVDLIATGSPMHDIGKIMIPDAILMKPGKLTEEEFAEMKNHSVYGCEVLERTKDIWPDSYNRICNEICRYHHERYDGRGYPDGLKGDEIPISAQIVGLADVYDALVTDRVYKKAFSPETAYEMITTGQCGIFSDKLLESFDACREKMEAIAAK